MSNRLVTVPAFAALLLAVILAASPTAAAQSATPIPKLDPDRLIGTYYEIASYPIRREKSCLTNGMVLYALGDKKNSVQIVTTCEMKDGNSTSWNSAGPRASFASISRRWAGRRLSPSRPGTPCTGRTRN